MALSLAAPALAQDAAHALDHDHDAHGTPAPAGAGHDAHDDPVRLDAIVVQATRSGRSLLDEPIRVEVSEREEIEEKLLMRPGNIAMLVAEIGGIRTQVTSPALGAANIRIQGMSGRYTQLLADGLPLYGGQTASIGLLQIPPTDLGQVEVIKGAASALYGPSALGGVINLVSRRPQAVPESEVLLNVTSRSGQDLTAYTAAPLRDGLSYSLVGGVHHQHRQDLDDDGWIDMPGYERATVRPRLFWEGVDGGSAYLTIGAMDERRTGGTLPGRTLADGSVFPQAQDSTRFDIGLVAEVPMGEDALHLRASGMTQAHDHRFGDLLERDRHRTAFAEASYAAARGDTSWLAGVALQSDTYRSRTFPEFDYGFDVPALFGQAEHELSDALTLAGSARLDRHSAYGSFFSPRLSVLYRPGDWTVRGSLGRGLHAPTPFVEEIEAAGLSRLAPLGDLEAETATTASLDVGRVFGGFESSLTLFASRIRDAVQLQPLDDDAGVRLVNAEGATRTAGAEALLRYRWDDVSVTGSYVYVDASETTADGGRRATPLTPRHTAGLVAMWEQHGRGRVGVEAYYTGSQPLDGDPYLARGKPYLLLGVLGEVTVGRASWFLNLENLLDVRQTREAPLVLPQRAADGRWTVDAWAPIDGFVVNGGVRIRFGGY